MDDNYTSRSPNSCSVLANTADILRNAIAQLDNLRSSTVGGSVSHPSGPTGNPSPLASGECGAGNASTCNTLSSTSVHPDGVAAIIPTEQTLQSRISENFR